MSFSRRLSVLLLLVAPCCALAGDARHDANDRAALIGSWDLVSVENRAIDGSVSKPFGAAPVGRITYGADGHMSAQLMRAGRASFASNELYGGSDAEQRKAYQSFIAYYGSFEVNSATQVVTHHVIGSLFPNWSGRDQRRRYAIKGDELELSSRPFIAQGKQVTAHVLWRRAH